jgi:hypothetical protein
MSHFLRSFESGDRIRTSCSIIVDCYELYRYSLNLCIVKLIDESVDVNDCLQFIDTHIRTSSRRNNKAQQVHRGSEMVIVSRKKMTKDVPSATKNVLNKVEI